MLRTEQSWSHLIPERKIVRVMSINQGWTCPAHIEAKQALFGEKKKKPKKQTSAIRGFKLGTPVFRKSQFPYRMSALITNPWKMSLRATPVGRSAKEWAWAGVEKVGRGGVGWGPTSFPSWCIIFKWKDNSQRLLALMIPSVIFRTAWSRDTFRKCFSCRSALSHLPLSLANGINVCLSILNFICHIAAQRGKHIVLYFPCLSNWSSCFSPALCCQQNVTRLQSVSWSEVITCRRKARVRT